MELLDNLMEKEIEGLAKEAAVVELFHVVVKENIPIQLLQAAVDLEAEAYYRRTVYTKDVALHIALCGEQ